MAVEGLELAGRGRRASEPLCSSFEDQADDLFQQLRPRVATGRYALYGHSMGALLALLAVRRICHAGLPRPEALFLSGSDAPSTRKTHRRHLLPRPEFHAVLEEMGGCPPEVLQDRELLAFFEPILRADFKAVETWQSRPEPPVDVPLVVMNGSYDGTLMERARAWTIETTASCQLHEFNGDHFFILRHWPGIASIIRAQLGVTSASS